jgi:hypothetical protein
MHAKTAQRVPGSATLSGGRDIGAIWGREVPSVFGSNTTHTTEDGCCLRIAR